MSSNSESGNGVKNGGMRNTQQLDGPGQTHECFDFRDELQLATITYSMSSETHPENEVRTPTSQCGMYCFSPVQLNFVESQAKDSRKSTEGRSKRPIVSPRTAAKSSTMTHVPSSKRSKCAPSPRIDSSGRSILSPRPESYPPRGHHQGAPFYRGNDIAAGMLGNAPSGGYNPQPFHSAYRHPYMNGPSSYPQPRFPGPLHHGGPMPLHQFSLKFLSNHSSAWNDRFKELLSYKKEHGDCLVPQRFPQNPQLGVWVNKQRAEYKLLKEGKKSSMTHERISALESVGFVWAKRRKGQPTWDLKFEELKRYRAENGDCLVPTKYGDNPALGRWVSTQRAQYKLMQEGKPTTMTQERVHLLENLGFVWRLQF